ncbi:MAG: NADH-quinone oxidoreductase subunit NuoE [Maricaulaceae bacterium]
MGARRLAIRQPDSFKLSAAAKKEIAAWVAKYPDGRQRSALIPALWIAQKDAGGWLPEAALRVLGDMLDMAYIRVYEVATFYTMFNLMPVGVHFVQLCGTTPCWLRGSDDLIAMLKRKIGPQGTISEDGKLSWLEVECLGACANAPMAQISNTANDHYYEDLTAENLEAVLDDLVAGKTPDYGPQNSRHTSEPEGGAQALTTNAIFDQEVTLKALPNAGKKAKVVYHAADPKGRRATTAGRKVKPKTPASTKAKAKPSKKSTKPKVLYTDGPTDGQPDDLKKIKGIGPKFEGDLNGKGVYYFRQIAAWKAADVKMVEGVIDSFPGRIKRDEWIKQAKTLAKSAGKA